jgi:GNAT superfamily N-acetyltransferase
MKPKLTLTDTPPPQAYGRLLAHLRQFNQDNIGDATPRILAILMTDPATDDLVGGLWGHTLWGSYYTDMLFVPETLRRAGHGRKLMSQAEEEAVRRGCWSAWVDTYNFQARGFYERLGYSVFGVINGEPPAFPRFFLQKELTAGS